MLQDLRYAWRSLRRTPGFTTAALLTLALGIGATTAIFSLVNATLLKPVPYPEPDRIAILTGRYGSSPVAQPAQSGLTFTLVRDRLRVVEAVTAQSGSTSWNLSTSESAVSVRGLRVSTDYLKVHGVRPLVGREFTTVEDTPSGPDSAMVSESPRETSVHQRHQRPRAQRDARRPSLHRGWRAAAGFRLDSERRCPHAACAPPNATWASTIG